MQKKATQFLKDSIVRSANAAALGMSVWLLMNWLSVHEAKAQGAIYLENRITSGNAQTTHVYAPLSPSDTVSVVGLGLNDTPAGASDFGGRALIGASGMSAQYGAATTRAQLVMALGTNAPESSLLPVGQTTTFRTGVAAGFIAQILSTISSIPTTPAPTPIGPAYTGPMTFSIVAWDNSSGLYPTWQEAKPAWESGLIAAGMMTPFSMTSLGGGTTPATRLTQMGQNLTSFNLYFVCQSLFHYTSQPQSQTVPVGQNATFTVSVSGSPPFYYQWQFNGEEITGATDSAYTLLNAQATSIGHYSVVVRNFAACVETSSDAFLNVSGCPPLVLAQPQSQTVWGGDNTSFSAVAAGTRPLAFQWQFNGTNIAGATWSTLILTNVQLGQAGSYSVQVTNPSGSTNSASAMLTVSVSPPSIVAQPQSQALAPGDNAIFSTDAIGTAPLTFQWQFNGTNIAGATGNTLMLPDVQLGQAGSYSVQVANLFGSTNSASGVLTVATAPCTPLPLGLVSWWPGEGNANDIAGTSNGALSNSVDFTSGKVGQAFELNGSSSYVEVPDSDLWAFDTNSFTIELWASFNVVPTGIEAFLGSDEGGGNLKKWFFAINGGVLTFHINDPGVGSVFLLQAPFTPKPKEWYHLAVVRNGRVFTVFTNGVAAGSQTHSMAMPNANAPLTIGQAEGYYFNGCLDEVSLYRSALSANEIAAIWNARTTGKCTTSTPPFIFVQPADQTALASTNVSLGVTAGGTPPLSYQWQFNGTNIAWATNATLVLTNVQPSHAGDYSVVVTNIHGVATSDVAQLEIREVMVFGNGQPLIGTNYTFVGSITLSLQTGFTNGFMFYTLDGSVPTTSSPFYTGPIALTNSATVQAMSLSGDFSQTAFSPVSAVQIIPVYNLQRAAVGGGTISANPPNGPYPSNSVVVLTANGVPNWFFGNWTGDLTGSQNPASLSMNGPRSVQAVFFKLHTSVVGDGTVSVSSTTPPYGINTVAVLTANAAANWAFDHWTGDVMGSQNPENLLMNGPRRVQAVFVQTAYPLTVSTPGGGSVTVNGQPILPITYHTIGSVVTLAAVASSGWSFKEWQGDASGTNSPLDITMNRTNSVQAVFETVVGTAPVGGGSVVLSEPNPVPFGTTLRVSAVPDSGKYLVTWSGAVAGTNSPTAFVVTNATPVVNALFAALPVGKYALNAVVVGKGTVTVSPQQSYYNPGDTVTLTAVPDAGASFFGWSGDAGGTNNPLTVVVTTNKVIQANFIAPPSVTVSPPNLVVLAGSNAVLTANAAGLPPLSYQWQNSTGWIAGATDSTYTILNAQTTDNDSYSVIVSNPYGSVTSGVATVTVVFPPSIVQEPRSWTVPAGTVLDLSVSASGTEPLGYQWMDSSGAIPGATSATYNLNPVQVSDAGSYSVVVTNAYGAVTSAVATLTVYVPVSITTQPASQVVPSRSTVSFSVVAEGYPVPAYQWTFNGASLAGATSSILSLTNVLMSDMGEYAVLVGNGYSSQLSDVASLSMSPSITSPFIGATTIWGKSAVLSVGAIGSGDLVYQWYKDGVAIDGATDATLNFTSIQFTNGGLYSVVVSSLFGSATNVAAQVVVNPAGVSLSFSPTLTIEGVIGYSYIIDRTADLANTNAWVTLTNLTLAQPVEIWVDTSVDASSPFHPKYFYRILPGQ